MVLQVYRNCPPPHPPVLQKSAETRDSKELGLRSCISRVWNALNQKNLLFCFLVHSEKSPHTAGSARPNPRCVSQKGKPASIRPSRHLITHLLLYSPVRKSQGKIRKMKKNRTFENRRCGTPDLAVFLKSLDIRDLGAPPPPFSVKQVPFSVVYCRSKSRDFSTSPWRSGGAP